MRKRRLVQCLYLIICVFFLFKLKWISEDSEYSAQDILLYRLQSSDHDSDFNKRKTKTVKMIITGYMRGGTSFIGEYFNQNKDVFYWFEPLAASWDTLNDVTYRRHVDTYPNGTMRYLTQQEVDEFSGVLRDVLNCEFKRMDIRPLTHQFITWWDKSKKTAPYSRCLQKEMLLRNSTVRKRIPTSAVNACLPELKEQCTRSPIRVIKTIRLPGYILKDFFTKNDDVKVIYYVRDPRGVLHSRQQVGMADLSNMSVLKKQALELCDRLIHDKSSVHSLQKSNPNSFLSVKYESFAKHPIFVSKHLYHFLQVPYPKYISSWLKENTNSRTNDHIMGTKRNASATVGQWRRTSKFSKKAKATVTKACKPALRYHGYRLSIE